MSRKTGSVKLPYYARKSQPGFLFLLLALFTPALAKGAPQLTFAPFEDAAPRPLSRDHFLKGGLQAALAVKLSQIPQVNVTLPGEGPPGTDLWVLGWYHRHGQDGVDLSLEAALLDLRSGSILWAGETEGKTEEISSLLDTLAEDLLSHLGIFPNQEELLRLKAPLTRDPYAFVIFGRGINALLGLSRPVNHKDATELLRRAVLIDPRFAESRFYLALQILAVGEEEKAIALFKDSITDRPGLLPAYRHLGALYTKAGYTALATATFQELLAFAPDDSAGRMRLAELLLSQGDLKGAESEFLEVTRRDPDHLAAYRRLAEIYWNQGEGTKAANALRAVIRLDPSDLDARYALGAFLREEGNAKGAEILYRNAVKLDAQNPTLWRLLGDVRRDEGDTDGAITAYAEALKISPKDTATRLSLGGLYLAQKQYEEAEKLFSSAISFGAKNAEAYGGLGLAHLGKGDIDGAILAFQSASALAPDDPALSYNLGTALLAKGRCKEAKIAFGKAVIARPDFAQAHYNLGVTALQCYNPRDEKEAHALARRSFETAVALDPSLPEAHYNLAVLLEKDGELEEAAKEFSAYLVAFPSAEDQDEISARIRALRGEGTETRP